MFDADDCIELSARYGLRPDPWQERVVRGWLGVLPDGRWAAARCGLAVPRQNGKNGVLEMVELYKMVVLGRRVLHTAHEVKTARKAFVRLASFFENVREFPELGELVQSIRRTNGQEAILLKNGGSVEFIARSKGSGRGFTVDDLVCDEAQDLNDDALAALLPTISAAPSGNPQVTFTGTPPVYRHDGLVWQRFRDAGVAGEDARLAWFEWSVPDDLRGLDAVGDAVELAWETNPALGIRLNIGTVVDEFAAMPADVFLRERLGRWDEVAAGSRLVSREVWDSSGLEPDRVRGLGDGVRVFGVAFSLNGSRAALCGGVKHSEVGVHVELVDGMSGDLAHGVTALAEWLAERKDSTAMIAISGRAWSDVLRRKLVDLGVPKRTIRVLTTGDYLNACSLTFGKLLDGSLTHTASEGQRALDNSVATSDKKERGGGAWGWSVTVEGADETPIEAFSLAAWAAMTARRRPGKRATGLVMT